MTISYNLSPEQKQLAIGSNFDIETETGFMVLGFRALDTLKIYENPGDLSMSSPALTQWVCSERGLFGCFWLLS